jgi:hypothetical protein
VVGAAGELRAGSLVVTRCYWDRIKLLDGEYVHGLPDFRLEFRQVLFRSDELRFLADALLQWSDLPLANLAVTHLDVEVQLSGTDRQELRLRFDRDPDYSRGDRTRCTLFYRTCALEDLEAGTCTFVVDVSGAHRFGAELLAALAPSA